MIDRASLEHFARLADRCHVGDTYLGVAKYARSRLKRKGWRALSPADRRKLLRALFQRHTDNGSLYLKVSRGNI